MEISNKIKDTKDLAVSDLRKDALAIAEAGFSAIDTKEAIDRMLHLVQKLSQLKGISLNLRMLKDYSLLVLVSVRLMLRKF